MYGWMRVLQCLGTGQLVMAGMATLPSISQATASSVVLGVGGCAYQGNGAPLSTYSMSASGAENKDDKIPMSIACSVPTDPSTRNLKVTFFYATYSTVPAPWIITGQTTSTLFFCNLFSRDRASPETLVSTAQIYITSGRAGASVGSLAVSMKGVHKINNIACNLPFHTPYLRALVTGYQVDQS